MMIKITKKKNIATITIDRPKVHNAFNDELIAKLIAAFQKLEKDDDTRVIILTGIKSSFCAGADIQWMQRMKDFSHEENIEDAGKLFELMEVIDRCSKPTIARVNGYAMGGGAGLIAVCDVAVASDDAIFMLSNVQYGFFPAVIAPFLVRKVGSGFAREYFLTGERFDAERALHIGLINRIASKSKLDKAVEKYTSKFLSAGPDSIKICKELLHASYPLNYAEVKKYHSETIARMRMSEEGQEGFKAFLDKRLPYWVK